MAIVVLILLSLLAGIADSAVVFILIPTGLALVVALAYETVLPVWDHPESDRLYAAAVWFLTFAPAVFLPMLVGYLSLRGDSGDLLVLADIEDMELWIVAAFLAPPFLSIGGVALAVSFHRGRTSEWLYTAVPGLFLISILPGAAVADAIPSDFFTVYDGAYLAILPAVASVVLTASTIFRVVAPAPGFHEKRTTPVELPDLAT